jgi:hypothetical protein
MSHLSAELIRGWISDAERRLESRIISRTEKSFSVFTVLISKVIVLSQIALGVVCGLLYENVKVVNPIRHELMAQRLQIEALQTQISAQTPH